jgi:putative DNA primase/helicase
LDREHQIGVPLERKRVFILPDNDKLGRKHAQDIAASLHGKADISIIELPGLPKKGDIVDFFEKQGPENAAKLLIDLCVAAKQWTPSTETTAPAGEPLRTNDSLGAEIDIPDYHFTDLGNAERLIRNHKGTILFCYPYNQWLRWDRRTWPVDISGDIERKAKETIKKIYREASAAADEDQRTAIAKHAMRSESGSKIKSMLELARMDVPVLPKDLDADPWLFNIQNGTVDLKTGQLQPHNSGDLITKISTVIYDPGAKCPLFESFLDRITQSRSGLIDFLQRTVGYALTGLTIEQCFFVLYGIGANGKTTFLEVLRKVLGDYGQQANFATFLNTRSKNSSNDLAALKGARVVCASESGAGQSLNESLIKHITGGEAIRARFLWGEFFEYYPEFKIFLASNHRPPIRNADLGIWRRVRLIPFDEVIPIEEQDQDLLEKLFEELPGILNWMLKGCLDWQKNKLGMSEEVKQATDLYKSESDVFGTFFEEKCIFTPEVEVKSGDLQKAYRRWCEKSGEKPAPLHILTDNLKMRGCSTKRTNQGRFWEGIGLLGGET